MFLAPSYKAFSPQCLHFSSFLFTSADPVVYWQAVNFLIIFPPLFFGVSHFVMRTKLYKLLLYFAVNNFCFAFSAGMFRTVALVVLAYCAFNHFDPPLLTLLP